MIQQRISALALRGAAAGCAGFLALAAIAWSQTAQAGATITIRILDGKTGAPINPSNLIIRIDRREEPDNEGLKLNGSDPATAALPAGATVVSVQGAYGSASTEEYINCDADAAKDTDALQWYSIEEIMKTGIVAPDHCYKGKYEHKFNVIPKPGEFVFFVRAHSWHDLMSD